MVLRRKIDNYDTWRPVYEELEETLQGYGCKRKEVYRGVDDPNMVVVMLEFDSDDQCRAFANCEEFAAARRAPGATGEEPDAIIG